MRYYYETRGNGYIPRNIQIFFIVGQEASVNQFQRIAIIWTLVSKQVTLNQKLIKIHVFKYFVHMETRK